MRFIQRDEGEIFIDPRIQRLLGVGEAYGRGQNKGDATCKSRTELTVVNWRTPRKAG